LPTVLQRRLLTKGDTVMKLTGYHAHVYFDATSRETAQRLIEAVAQKFELTVGRLHDQAVGPHPRGSCQLAFTAELFGPVIAWLMLNRGGLTVFAHALSGDALKDHTEHVLWLGPSEPLNLSALAPR
jgi:aromatic ring-cleaving dioxygenase